MAMKFPRHLWTGEWRLESEQAREAAEEEAARRRAALAAAERDRAAAQPAGAPPRTIRLKTAAAAALVAAAVAGGAFAAGALLHDDNNVQPLPAVSGKPIAPDKGQTRAGAIYAQASPAVVSIRTDVGSGTGFLIDGNGTLVTNAHVVGNADRVVVKFGPDGRNIDGEVRGTDPSSDLAVVHIDPGSAPAQRQAAAVRRLAQGPGRRHRDRDRQPVRPRPHRDRGHRLGPRALDPGAQRLLDRRGHPDRRADQPRQLGRPAARRRPAASSASTRRSPPRGTRSGNVGIGFAVPSNTVRQVVPRLEQGETIARAWLGVATADPTDPTRHRRRRGHRPSRRRPGRRAPACSSATSSPSSTARPSTTPPTSRAIVNTKQPGDHVHIWRRPRRPASVTLDVHAAATVPRTRHELRRAARSCSRWSLVPAAGGPGTSRPTARPRDRAAPRPRSRRPR